VRRDVGITPRMPGAKDVSNAHPIKIAGGADRKKTLPADRRRQAARVFYLNSADHTAGKNHSHSIVPGGLLVTS
jgi:hypothetical protein